MVAAGVLHFVIPGSYRRIVPRVLGHARALVAVTGVIEMAAGALVAVPRTRRAGAWLTLVLLVVVWPANIQMALDGGIAGAGFPANSALLSWLRVPLQLPLFAWAYRQTRPAAAPRVGVPGPDG
jgi:uncharacterized membrane protein